MRRERRHDRKPRAPIEKRGLVDGSCPESTTPTEAMPDAAPPSESAGSPETHPDVMQTALIGEAAQMRALRCPSDLMFLVSSVRPTSSFSRGAFALSIVHQAARVVGCKLRLGGALIV